LKSPLAPPPGTRRVRPRRRLATGLAAALAAGVTLAGCSVDNTPKAYDEAGGIIRQNFVATCTGKIPNQSTTTILASDAGCECAFNVFRDKVPYNAEDRAGAKASYPADKPTFHDLEGSLRDNPGKYNDLPESIRTEVDKCKNSGTVGPVAGGSGTTGTTTGTAAPDTTTTAP
jgi:hypothetical protein